MRGPRITWAQALETLERVEETGVGFWHRNSDDTITIFVRGAHGNDPDQWYNANSLFNWFDYKVDGEIAPDPQSGHLIIRLKAF